MLILTRREGEEIVIGRGEEEVRVRVASVDGNRVKLAIEARREVKIRRSECKTLDTDPGKRNSE
ncbi:MAG: carbon storage regulator [Planctomycetales bacterium]|nr:carbon storage regulator [Planctomycetales bacterium]